MNVPPISQAAIDEIVSSEVSSKADYIRSYQRPTWPEGASGVTIGIGYDVGYVTQEGLWADWKGKIPDDQIELLAQACGITGQNAHDMTLRMRDYVSVPWEAAMNVFLNRDVPKWTALVIQHLPHAATLPPDCLGALTSLAYNRGDGGFENASNPRFAEMHHIHDEMVAGNLHVIPGEFRNMKRLWSNGLVARREREAKMFERGLAAAGL